MNRSLSVAIPVLSLAALLICITACSGQSLSPPDNLRIEKLSSGAFRDLEWNNPNDSLASFELEWRFGDVPHWVHLSITAAEATTYGGRHPGEAFIAPWNLATYCYRGRAILGNSASEWSDEVCEYMGAGEPHPPPIWPAPAKHVAAEPIEGGVRLTWTSHDYREYGPTLSLVLRRESTSGKYTVIGELPFATFSAYESDGPNHGDGIFEFIDREGSRDYCYRIGTKFEDRGKSISGDVCVL